MGKDPDRSGAADSCGESAREPGQEPDEFDSLVLDEVFIAAGIPEASLAPHQRSIRRGATDGTGSIDRAERQRLPRPEWADPFAAPGDSGWPPRSHHTRGQRRTTAVLLAAAVVLLLGVALTAFLHLRTGLRGAAGTSGTAGDAAAAAVRQELAGLTPIAPLGTCFGVQTGSVAPLIQVQPCSQSHRYELVGVESASGRNNAYPANSYWKGPIDDQCARDLQVLTGRAPADWPVGLHVGSLVPTPTGWASGDRTVYCIADSTPSSSSALHQLNTSVAVPTG